MTTLTDFRTRVLWALGVSSSTERGLSDANVDEHVRRAVEEFSLYVPVETSADVTVPGGSRAAGTGSLVRPIRVTAVEYPIGQWPRALLDFDTWGGTVILDHSPPTVDYTVRLYYTQQHLVDGSGSTVSAAHAREKNCRGQRSRMYAGADAADRSATGRARIGARCRAGRPAAACGRGQGRGPPARATPRGEWPAPSGRGAIPASWLPHVESNTHPERWTREYPSHLQFSLKLVSAARCARSQSLNG